MLIGCCRWKKEERSRLKKERKKQALLEKIRKEKEEAQLRSLQEKEAEELRQAELNARVRMKTFVPCRISNKLGSC